MKKSFDKPILNNEDIEVLLPIFCYGYEIPGKTLKIISKEDNKHIICLTDGKIEKEVAKIVDIATVDFSVLYWGNRNNYRP